MSNSAFTPAVLTIPAAATTATGELNVISNPSAASLSTTGWTGVTAVGTNSIGRHNLTTAGNAQWDNNFFKPYAIRIA